MISYTEDHFVEQPAIQLMQDVLGSDVLNCYGEWDGGMSRLGTSAASKPCCGRDAVVCLEQRNHLRRKDRRYSIAWIIRAMEIAYP